MILGLRVLILVCSLIGIVVCRKGMKTKNILYRGSFYFFLLLLIEKVYSLIMPSYIEKLIDQGIDNPGLLVTNSTIPPLILTAVGLVVFLIYMFKGINKSSSN